MVVRGGGGGACCWACDCCCTAASTAATSAGSALDMGLSKTRQVLSKEACMFHCCRKWYTVANNVCVLPEKEMYKRLLQSP